jgi:hypothetical protein
MDQTIEAVSGTAPSKARESSVMNTTELPMMETGETINPKERARKPIEMGQTTRVPF